MPTKVCESAFLESWERHKSPTKVADELGIALRSVMDRASRMRKAGHNLPVNRSLSVKGESTLYGADGETRLTWVKTAATAPSPAEIAETIREALIGVRPAPSVAPPKLSDKDLLTVYPIGDHHVGMYAWAEEAGDDYDLKKADALLSSAIHHLVNVSRPSERALIVDVGDFQHYDTIKAETVRSAHTLDADSRYHAMIRLSLKLMRYCIETALTKHKQVTVICTPGNHNDMGAVWMSEALSLYYSKNPRVNVHTKAGKFHFYEFGKVLIGVTHGDTGKPERLAGTMASDAPEAWGRTRHRHWLTGHVHNRTFIEMPGVTWETFRTLAARDAWASGAGYRSGRDMQSITYHRENGEVERRRFDVCML